MSTGQTLQTRHTWNTHDVLNQVDELTDFNLLEADPALLTRLQPILRKGEWKVTVAVHDASQVARAGLCETICRGAGQLVLVRAPAGFGKTTAMMQARVRLEDAGVATAWLTLDRADNDVSRFLNCLDTAVRQLGLPGNDTVQALSRALSDPALNPDGIVPELAVQAGISAAEDAAAQHAPRPH